MHKVKDDWVVTFLFGSLFVSLSKFDVKTKAQRTTLCTLGNDFSIDLVRFKEFKSETLKPFVIKNGVSNIDSETCVTSQLYTVGESNVHISKRTT